MRIIDASLSLTLHYAATAAASLKFSEYLFCISFFTEIPVIRLP
jgi:hypothetical protein